MWRPGAALLATAVVAPASGLLQSGHGDGALRERGEWSTRMIAPPDHQEDGRAENLIRALLAAGSGGEDALRGGVQADCSVRQCKFFDYEGACAAFASEADCAEMHKQRTWLASFPGSGNTWARVMIQAITGVYTGSMYFDKHLNATGLRGEGQRDPRQVLTVKTHLPVRVGPHPKPTSPQLFGRAIVITRHPLKAMLSWVALRVARGDHGRELPERQVRRRFDMEKRLFMSLWVNHTRYWHTEFQGEKLVVKYEDIGGETLATYMDRILPFLHVDVEDPHTRTVVQCAIDRSNAEHSTHRGHSYEFAFNDEDYDLIRPHERMIRRLGYDLTPP